MGNLTRLAWDAFGVEVDARAPVSSMMTQPLLRLVATEALRAIAVTINFGRWGWRGRWGVKVADQAS